MGAIIAGPDVLERARTVRTIALDKTGTVTRGDLRVVAVHPADGVTEADLLRLAGTAESGSEHPLARAIVAAASPAGLGELQHFENVPGEGVRATVDGVEVAVRRPDAVGSLPQPLASVVDNAQGRGETPVVVLRGAEPIGVVALADTIKETSAHAIGRLKALGLSPVLLTGDNERAARAVADRVGIDEVRANVRPEGKVAVVRELQSRGQVAMVGDGVNDAAALAASDLGIAMGSGTDAAKEAAGITLMRGDLVLAVDAIRLSRRTLRTIRTNLFWAFAYNVAAIPLAALGMLTPMIAGAAMAFSSVFVVANSLLLRGFRPESR